MPFGGGRRICPGNKFSMLEMKTALAILLRRFTFKTDPDRPMIEQETAGLFGFDAERGFPIFVKERA